MRSPLSYQARTSFVRLSMLKLIFRRNKKRKKDSRNSWCKISSYLRIAKQQNVQSRAITFMFSFIKINSASLPHKYLYFSNVRIYFIKNKLNKINNVVWWTYMRSVKVLMPENSLFFSLPLCYCPLLYTLCCSNSSVVNQSGWSDRVVCDQAGYGFPTGVGQMRLDVQPKRAEKARTLLVSGRGRVGPARMW